MKNALPIFGGVAGAVAGFVATLLVLELGGFGNKADPITSGLLALAVLAPAGAVAGLVARRRTHPNSGPGNRTPRAAKFATAPNGTRLSLVPVL